MTSVAGQATPPEFASSIDPPERVSVDLLFIPNATAVAVAKQVTTTVPIGVRVAVLRTPTAISTSAMRKMMPSAEYLNVHVLPADIHSSEDIPVALEAASRAGADALFTFLSPLTLINMRAIIEFASRHRLPSMFSDRRFVDARGLMSYRPNRPEMYRRTAAYVDRILKGASPAELPVELASVLESVVNLTTASALGIAFTPDVASQVTEWVQRGVGGSSCGGLVGWPSR